MATQQSDIREWLERGKEEGATHLIVATDTWDWEDYPVFVKEGEDPLKIAAKHEKVMEIYSLSRDWNSQLNEHRAYHYD